MVSKAQWNWTLGPPPSVITYPTANQPTKTGLQPNDLRNFVGVPLVINTTTGPVPLTDTQLIGYIRQAEDWVEQNGGVTLTTTYVASPPLTPAQLGIIQFPITSPYTNGQVLGVDYDLKDIGYDFIYRRWLGEGWGVQPLRYRPIQNIYLMVYIYPLLSEFFNVPLSWIQLDNDYGMIRIVPAANVQMLPLFAMQISLTGFAMSSLPQAIYYQYIAGLTSADYNTRFSFILTLVLDVAALIALNTVQGSVNFGSIRQATSVDGLRYDTSWPNNGAAYSGLITNFKTQRDEYLQGVIDLVRGGITLTSL